ncbi:hypothetical protein COCNU_01G018240 [Cocos nucifera]|uniref:Uncharacterized protein n=1 Tax=Cocos nucifera TaxID=13894 RepID=A0A8K0HXA6_COCNU|nr:hypothetical protein COCNU_01G018240 [Cocos nucifera]
MLMIPAEDHLSTAKTEHERREKIKPLLLYFPPLRSHLAPATLGDTRTATGSIRTPPFGTDGHVMEWLTWDVSACATPVPDCRVRTGKNPGLRRMPISQRRFTMIGTKQTLATREADKELPLAQPLKGNNHRLLQKLWCRYHHG